MLGVFAGLGLGLTATEYVAECRTRDPERAGRIVALGCTVAIASGGLLALVLSQRTGQSLPQGRWGTRTWRGNCESHAPCCSLNALNGAQTGALSGFEAFRAIAPHQPNPGPSSVSGNRRRRAPLAPSRRQCDSGLLLRLRHVLLEPSVAATHVRCAGDPPAVIRRLERTPGPLDLLRACISEWGVDGACDLGGEHHARQSDQRLRRDGRLQRR